MISDLLAEASSKIQRYLDQEGKVYKGPLPERLERLVTEMRAIQSELDTRPEWKSSTSISALPSSSPESGMLPEGIGYKDTKAEQMVRLLKQFQVIDRGQFIIDCINGKEDNYISQHQEKQVVKPLAKWLRDLAGRP